MVGDSQQLPPTQFFVTNTDDDLAGVQPEAETKASLLEECTGIGFRDKLLRYHYRSRKEGLIAFSNAEFYDQRLYTFPDLRRLIPASPNGSQIAPAASSSSPPSPADSIPPNPLPDASNSDRILHLPAIDFRYIATGVYENRKNLPEAQAVAQAILAHFEANQPPSPPLSLGVVAFSQSQQEVLVS